MLNDEQIREKIRSLEIFLGHAEEICQIAKRDINTKISKVREECHHHEIRHVSDASGNNDSYNYCTVCGLEKKRF